MCPARGVSGQSRSALRNVAIDRLYYRAKGYFTGRELYFFDPSGNHTAKVYGSYGRFYEEIPMDLVIRSYSYERQPRIINYDPLSTLPDRQRAGIGAGRHAGGNGTGDRGAAGWPVRRALVAKRARRRPGRVAQPLAMRQVLRVERALRGRVGHGFMVAPDDERCVTRVTERSVMSALAKIWSTTLSS